MDPEATPPKTQIDAFAPLPEGWENAVSPVDGREYYYNASTGATSWTHPSLPGSTAVPEPPKDEIQNVPSVGDFSGIIANRSTIVDYGDSTSMDPKDIEEGNVYTKMTEYDARRPINAHRCYSVIAMILFFPLGVIAFCRSLATVSKWKQERYETAHDCSQQALLFSRISCIIGVIFWSYFAYSYFAGPEALFAMDILGEWKFVEEYVEDHLN